MFKRLLDVVFYDVGTIFELKWLGLQQIFPDEKGYWPDVSSCERWGLGIFTYSC